jgi:hypothetical protein
MKASWRCVLCLVFVAEDAQCRVEDRILIMQDERVERVEVALLRGLDECGFVHGCILPLYLKRIILNCVL